MINPNNKSPSSTLIPAKIIKDLSKTNDARLCFAYQKFSNSHQAFLVNYVLNISTVYSVYK